MDKQAIIDILIKLHSASVNMVDYLDRKQWSEEEEAFFDAILDAETFLVANESISTPSPDEVLMQDFVGIGFEGGAQTALAEKGGCAVSLPTINELLDSTTQENIRAEFSRIETAVNEALKKAAETDGSWRGEAINWADLKCAAVEFIVGEHDGYYMATIEEASPACPSLRNFVGHHLESVGLLGVVIVTEW